MKKNKMLLIAAMLLLAMASCVKTEYHYVDENLKAWFVDGDKANFTVVDQNDIAQQFVFQGTKVDMLPGSSYFMFVKTDEDLCENLYQNGRVSFYDGNACGLSVTNYYSLGHHFALYFYDVMFVVNVDGDGFSCTQCSDQKLIEHNYRCTMELLRSHEVNGVVYDDVMRFRITDLDAVTRNTFPTELYYAKHYGPIEYELGGKVRYLRKARNL